MACACGIPRKADYYIKFIIGREVDGGTQTGYVDGYVCAEHAFQEPTLSDGWRVIESSKPQKLKKSKPGESGEA